MDINLIISVLSYLVENGTIKYFRVSDNEIHICIKK